MFLLSMNRNRVLLKLHTDKKVSFCMIIVFFKDVFLLSMNRNYVILKMYADEKVYFCMHEQKLFALRDACWFFTKKVCAWWWRLTQLIPAIPSYAVKLQVSTVFIPSCAVKISYSSVDYAHPHFEIIRFYFDVFKKKLS